MIHSDIVLVPVIREFLFASNERHEDVSIIPASKEMMRVTWDKLDQQFHAYHNRPVDSRKESPHCFVFGSPGTGKSLTTFAWCSYITHHNPSFRVLFVVMGDSRVTSTCTNIRIALITADRVVWGVESDFKVK